MRYLASIIFLLSTIIGTQTHAATPATPDFAFPHNVSREASQSLRRAIQTADGPGTVRAVMDYTLASGSVDADNLADAIVRIDSVRNLEVVQPATRAVLDILMADIYSELYNHKRWVYDNREIASEPIPANYEEWNGQQFRQRITSLIDSSLNVFDALSAIPLSQWQAVISCDTDSRPFFPSLYDFIAYKAINLLIHNTNSPGWLPARWLCPADRFVTLSFTYAPESKRTILNIYSRLLQLHESSTPAGIYADMQRLTFVNNSISGSSPGIMFTTLGELFTANEKSTEFAGIILPNMAYHIQDINDKRQLYDLCDRWLAKYAPKGPAPQKGLANAITSLKSRLKQQQLSAQFNAATCNGHPLQLKITSTNAPVCTVSVYRLPDSYKHNDRVNKIPATSLQKVDATEVNFNQSGLFEVDTIINLTPQTYGNYLLAVLLPGQVFDIKNASNEDIFTVTDISLQTLSYGNTVSVLALNPLSGEPLPGITLTGLKDTRASTDSNGLYPVTENINYRNSIYARLGKDQFSRPLQFYHDEKEIPGEWINECNLFTDLSIYHPGDTVRFGGVAYEYFTQARHRAKLLRNHKITTVLYNANGIATDTLICHTDTLGRIEGYFPLPKDGLTGRFSIRAIRRSSTYFTVSDYKLPTYELKVTRTARNMPETGDVTIEISALTYSGFPVNSADLTLRLSQSTNTWWRSHNSQPFYTTQGITDANGTAKFVLPTALLESAPQSGMMFTATIASTSQTGESQETSTTFSLGATNTIVAHFPTNMNISGKNVTLPVSVKNASEETVDLPLQYTLKQNNQIVKQGSFHSTSPLVDWSSVPSGEYSITISATDSITAEPRTLSSIVLYRPDDKVSPIKSPLWIPVTSYTVSRDKTTDILYGTHSQMGHEYILCTLWTNDSIISQKWIKMQNGMHTFPVSLPQGVNEATMTLGTMPDFTFSYTNITIRRADIPTALNIDIESFRDHITPGQKERWTLKVTDNTGTKAASGIILDMYSKALDALRTHNISLSIQSGNGKSFNIGWPNVRNTQHIFRQSKLGRQYYFNITDPQFITYGRSFMPMDMHIRGVRMMKSEATVKITGAGDVVNDHAEEVVVEESFAMAYSAADAGAITETAIVNDDAAINGDSEAEESPESSIGMYRIPEQPLAFFHPMLTTDNDGRLEFSFTAPNANTTWRLCAVAFTPDMLTGSITREIISNKPVMVQPNRPRFLRIGDSAQIQSAIMNNTDSAMHTVVRSEIFDPTTGTVTATYTDTLYIGARTSGKVSCTVHAPADTPFIGFRIKARINGFSDGEQSIIPILPASVPVIETIPFYMSSDSTATTLHIPSSGSERRITLQLCQNAAWYCVTALPGLRADEDNSANSAAAAIFSAAIAEGLLRDYPEIDRALHEWQTGDGADSTLISMLERNQDLKTVLLSATPWMLDARSDTERMTRLALLFDKKEIDQCYSKAIGQLSKLVRKGGWAWAEYFDQPSIWTTYNVLSMMGRLKRLGYMPKDKRLNTMINNAIGYIDRETAETYAKYPKSDFSLYTFIRGDFTDIPQPTAAAAASRTTVQSIVGSWRKMDVPDKARAAIVLHRNNYRTMARQIITSLDQYSKSTPQYGMWWPSLDSYYGWNQSKIGATALILDAYALITPGSRYIDDIRQWLIIQKEAENWGTSVTTTSVIASILTTGAKWIDTKTNLNATIGNKDIAINPTDRILGYSRSDISDMITGNNTELTISKTGNTPAWGAIFSQFTATADSVSAAGCDALNIEKRMFTARNTSSGINWVEANGYNVGERVRVQLTIRTTRDMDYVTIIDNRAAAFEPKDQLPAPIVSEGIYFYKENRDASTRMFVDHLPKGTYVLTYDLTVNNAGQFASGIATIQSQYAPQLTAHSSSSIVTVAQ